MRQWGRKLFFGLLIRPFLLLVIGLNVRHGERLPRQGPAIIVANHNSHLDVLVLMTLFPQRLLPRLHPVAARDYFARTRWLEWFVTRIIGAILIDRNPHDRHADPLQQACDALQQGDIIILFPEGSRGEPELLAPFKSGVAHLVRRCPATPCYPIFLHGLGKVLPRGEALLIPFFCDVFVGAPLFWGGDKTRFMADLGESMQKLAHEEHLPEWQ